MKDREAEPLVLLKCSMKDYKIKDKNYTFGVRLRYSTRYKKGEKTSRKVADQIKRMPKGVSFSAFVRIIDAGYNQPYLYDIYRTSEDKITIEARIYSVTAYKGEVKNK